MAVFDTEPLGEDQDGNPVFLKDIWPSNQEIQKFIIENVSGEMFASKYANVFEGDEHCREDRSIAAGEHDVEARRKPPPCLPGQHPHEDGRPKGKHRLVH